MRLKKSCPWYLAFPTSICQSRLVHTCIYKYHNSPLVYSWISPADLSAKWQLPVNFPCASCYCLSVSGASDDVTTDCVSVTEHALDDVTWRDIRELVTCVCVMQGCVLQKNLWFTIKLMNVNHNLINICKIKLW